MRSWAAMAGLVLAAAAACGGPQHPPAFTTWPASSPSYDDAYRRWTRRGAGRYGVDLAVHAVATLKSPEWRAAYVAQRAKRALLSAEQRAALEAQEREAAEKTWEVQLLVATHEYTWNDLDRRERSIWRLALVGDDGREVTPIMVREDRRPRGEIESWFPALGAFHRAYIVTFPSTTPDGTPLVSEKSARLRLKIGSALAGVTLTWE